MTLSSLDDIAVIHYTGGNTTTDRSFSQSGGGTLRVGTFGLMLIFQ